MVESGGLLGGITAKHLRWLCESGWNGGAGYTLEQVGRMSLDQIWFRLCDAKFLEREVGGRTERMGSLAAVGTLKPGKDGKVMGRAADGTPIRGRIGGKSKARQLMEQEEKRLRKEKRRKKRKR